MKIYRKLAIDIASDRVLHEDSYQYDGPLSEASAGTWKIFAKAKKIIGTGPGVMTSGGITLGVGVFKMSLHRLSASANLLLQAIGGISTFASVPGEISPLGGYVAGGRNLVPATGFWTTGASTKQLKFTYTTVGLVFTASGASLKNIKFAVIRTSSGAGAGKLVCFCTLSTAAFSIVSPNTLTILPAATGVFTLA